MQPLPLNQRLDRIGQHIVRARLFLDLWFYFEEQDSRRKIIDTMEQYSEVLSLHAARLPCRLCNLKGAVVSWNLSGY
jgi:hypothetical protein